MRLKSVELFGFKSFPDRTVIEFGGGITAVLGPNGCGKSNVVDAIKWVLGEGSAKNMRADEMLDVIFAGCESRAASGMAEVKLLFDNSDQLLPLPYAEVCVGRRLYRSRESEYFINNTTCRLRDIRNLFLDTGIGNSAYSVIEQGRVEKLLQAKPTERRQVFEEAAGISKIKQRRKETLSRVETTEQRLLRITDRLEDKERQIKKVSTQAANARRHRRLSEERDQLRRLLYTRQYRELTASLTQLAKQRETLESELDGENRSLTALSEQFNRLSQTESELTASRDQVVQAASETQEELTQTLMGQSEARNKIDTLTADIERGSQRQAELKARLERITAQREEVVAKLAEAELEASQLVEQYAGQDRERRELLQAASEAEAAVTILRNQVIDCNRRRQESSSAAARLEAAEQSTTDRLAEMDARVARCQADADVIAASVAELENQYNQAASGAGDLADALEQARREAASITAEAEQLQVEERRRESERAGKASRKATLEDLEHSMDGAYEGVKNILTAARNHHHSCQGVIGMALDLMTVPQDLALAIETILGASAQDVVVESARDAQSAIE
ncbi:MAG: AAA family ATPase, partial [Planctomycetes bacterium]|nr:AAA family ATPase [Planctomycetota bacterium]